MSEQWEKHYQEGHTPWDKGEASPGLKSYLAQRSLSGRILVPGCGLGHDVRAIAEADPGAEVVGLDLAPTAVKRAEEIVRVGGERYVQGDLFALPPEFASRFDWVWEHTCFCAIDPELREAYARAVAGALRAGGSLLGVFYLDPYDDEHVPGEGPPHGVEVEALTALLSGYFDLGEQWMPEQAYAGREGRELMMRWERNEVPVA